MRKTMIIISMLLVMLLFVTLSCTSKISQQDYDQVNNELIAAQNQIASLQTSLDEAEILETKNEELTRQYDTMKNEYDTLQTDYEELNKKYDAVNGEFETLQGKYDELNSAYIELSSRSEVVIEEPKEIVEEDVEQAIFALINQSRKNNGLDELLWGINLYKVAENNNTHMVEDQRLEYPEHGSYQEAFRATGYTKTDSLAEAVFTIWENTENYDLKFLNYVTIYGAVAVHKSGEIFYITYVADIFK